MDRYEKILQNYKEVKKIEINLIELRIQLFQFAKEKFGQNSAEAFEFSEKYITIGGYRLEDSKREKFTNAEKKFVNSRVEKAEELKLKINNLK